jgi:hypothetical protein
MLTGALLGALLLVAEAIWHIRRKKRRRVALRPPVDLRRLEEAAAVPLEEIVAAAEHWAEHPSDPEPAVLRNLLPEAWEPPRPMTRKALLTPPPDIQTARVPDGWITLPRNAPAERIDIHCGNSIILADEGMTWQPLPAAVTPQDLYAKCNHAVADREEIQTHGASASVRSIVTYCTSCVVIARGRNRLAEIIGQVDQITADNTKPNGETDFTEDLVRHLQRLLGEYDRITSTLDRLTNPYRPAWATLERHHQ